MNIESINKSIITFMYDKDSFYKIINELNENYFLDEYKSIFNSLVEYFKKYGKVPTLKEIGFECIRQDDLPELNWSINELKNRFKKDILKKAIKDGAINLSNGDVDKTINLLQESICRAATDDDSVITYDFKKNLKEIFKDFVKRRSDEEYKIKIPTGIKKLDSIIGGFMSEDLFFILGDPKAGKSFLLSYMAHYASKNHFNVLYFNLDQPTDLTFANLISYDTMIDRKKILNMELDKEEKRSIGDAINRFESAEYGRIKIVDGFFDFNKLYNYILAEILGNKVDLIIIDQLSNIDNNGKTEYDKNLSNVRSLLKIKKKIRKPILVASQLNREGYKERSKDNNSDKSLKRHHIAFTDAIVQVADGVLGLYRPNNDILVVQIMNLRKDEHDCNKIKFNWKPPFIEELTDEWYTNDESDFDNSIF